MADLSSLSTEDLMKMRDSHPDNTGSSGVDLSQMSTEDLMKLKNSASPALPVMGGRGRPRDNSGEPNSGEAGLQGAGQALTLGYLPEAQAMGGYLTPDPQKELNEKLQSQGFNIKEQPFNGINLKEARQRDLDLKKENPVSSIAGYLAGAAIQGPGLIRASTKYMGPVTGIGSGALQGGVTGGVLGAAQNPNVNPNDEGFNLGKRLKSGATSGLIGTALGGAAGLLATDPNAVKEAAGERGFGSLRPGLRDSTINQGRTSNIGQTLLNEGVITAKTKTPSDLADSIDTALHKRGAEFEDMMNKIMTVPEGFDKQTTFKTRDIIDGAKDELSHLGETSGALTNIRKINKSLKEFADVHPDELTIDKAQDLKVKLGKAIKWDRLPGQEIPQNEQIDRALYFKLQKGLEGAADNAASYAGPELKQQYLDLKNTYGNLKEAAKIANKSANREVANRYLSMSDYQTGQLAGVASLMTHANPVNAALMAGAGALGNKAVRTLGSQPMAYGLNKGAGALQSIQQEPAVQALINKLRGGQ